MFIFLSILLGGLLGGGFAIGMKRDVVAPAIVGALVIPLIVGFFAAPHALGHGFQFVAPQNLRFVSLLVGVIGAMWAGILAEHRRRSVIGWAIVGFFLPLLGVLLAATSSKLDARGEDSRLAVGAAS